MKHFLLVILSLVSWSVSAQQDPLYAQYFNNPMLINPAFAGSMDRLYAGVAYRSQWSGIPGGPVTFNFNSHMTVANNKVGVGLMAVQDQLGDIKNTEFGGTFSYKIKLQNAYSFSFGMQAGFTRFATDPNAVKALNNPDPRFNQFSETTFTTGVGALLQSDRLLVSLSAPRLLPGTVSRGGQSITVYGQNFYLYGAYSFYLNERVTFRPSTLLRATQGSSVSADVNCNFVFNRQFTAGVLTREFNTYGALLQMVFQNYRLGYVFEVPGKGSSLRYDTNEISLALSLNVLRSHSATDTGF